MSARVSILRDATHKLIEGGDTSGIPDYFAENYIVNFGSSRKSGHESIRGFTKAIHAAFARLRVDLETLIEADDRVAWRRTIHGTQTGAFQGFPASGLDLTWHEMVVSRFVNGKIAEEWVVSDLAEVLLRSRKR